MVNSVHTNVAALVALQALNKTNDQLQAAESRVSTGYRIATAKDDGAGFAIAQGLRSDHRGYEAITEQLSKAKGTMSVSNDAAKSISDTLGDIRAVITKLADANVAGTQRTQYAADYNNLKADIQRYIGNATFNGVNILNNATSINVIANLTGGSITLTAVNLTTSVYNVLPTITGATTAATVAATLTATGAYSNAEDALGTAMARLGADTKTLESHSKYIGVLADATEEGIGAIVDADLAKESAKLQALQIRQQLGTQTLSIANQAPNILLSLFQS